MKDIKDYIINESGSISHSEWENISCGEFRSSDGSILVYLTEALTLPFVKDSKKCLQITLLNAVKKREGVGTDLVNAIIEYANKINKDIIVYALPRGPFIGISQLIKFYKDLGFETEEECDDLPSDLNPDQLLRYKVNK